MRNNSTWAPSAPSPIAWPHEAWNAPLTVLAFAGGAFLNVAPALVYFVIAAASRAIDPLRPGAIPLAQLLIAQIVTFVPLGIYIAIVVPRLAHRSLRELGVRSPSAGQIGAGIAGTAAMFLIVSLASAFIAQVAHRHDTEAAVVLLQQSKSTLEKFLFFIVACVIAPIIEELEFRVFIFNALTRYISIPAAALTSGVVFGIVHASATPQLLTVSFPLAAGGVALAYVYALTRNYWSNVITHALFNSISVIAVFAFHAK